MAGKTAHRACTHAGPFLDEFFSRKMFFLGHEHFLDAGGSHGVVRERGGKTKPSKTGLQKEDQKPCFYYKNVAFCALQDAVCKSLNVGLNQNPLKTWIEVTHLLSRLDEKPAERTAEFL